MSRYNNVENIRNKISRVIGVTKKKPVGIRAASPVETGHGSVEDIPVAS